MVFGCGGDRDTAKRPLMGTAAAEAADVVIVTSDNPRSEDPASHRRASSADATRAAGAEPIVELTGSGPRSLAPSTARDGDVVLVAGKGHEQGQTAAGVTVAFDDRVVAADELGARGWA